MTKGKTVAPSSLENLGGQSHDPRADVQMKYPVINDHESQETNSEKAILSKMGEPQDFPDTIERRNTSNCVPRSCSFAGIQFIKFLTDGLKTWAVEHNDLKHLIADDLDPPVTPLYWLDTIMSKLRFHVTCGKSIRAWITNDPEKIKESLNFHFHWGFVPPEEHESVVAQLGLFYASVIKLTLNGIKFGIDDESTSQISDAETYPELRKVFEGLEKHYVPDSIPRKLFCFMDISKATSYANHYNAIQYAGSFLTRLKEIKEHHTLTSDEMLNLVGLYIVMQEMPAFESHTEIYEFFKEFLRADDISREGLKQAAKDYRRISFSKRTDEKKQNFFVLKNGEMVKIRSKKYPSFEEFFKNYSIGDNQGGASKATSAAKKSKTKGFRGKSKKNKQLVIRPCRRCSGQSHPFGQHIGK